MATPLVSRSSARSRSSFASMSFMFGIAFLLKIRLFCKPPQDLWFYRIE